ncbi:MAG TPA: helix-turn-helix domain-containing protein [Acidimicrobiales bacterium]
MEVDSVYMPTATRDRLLEAAREILAKDGLEGLTLRAIARHAGLSHGAPLRHFPSLASLLAAVAADGFARLVAAIDDALAEAEAEAAAAGRPPLRAVDRLAVAGRTYVDVALADPGVFAVTFRPERCDVSDRAYQRQGARSFGQLVGLVRAAQAEGWHAHERPELAAAAVWATAHGIADLALHGAIPSAVAPAGVADVFAVAGRLLFPGPTGPAGPGPAPGPGPGPGEATDPTHPSDPRGRTP